jgi:hypothetical protein
MNERRRNPRHPIREAARIVFNYRHIRRCTVRDISDDGACLETASTDIPDSFDLIRNRDSHICEVVWRTVNRLGVRFNLFQH